jgi:glycosyltransferase involved in cell wall biosynthesis
LRSWFGTDARAILQFGVLLITGAMKKPLVSVGIPTFNRPDGLRRTLEQVRSQSYRHLEIVVSDNASTDERVWPLIQNAIGEDFRIRAFRQDTNLGLYGNFKFVLGQATGEYFFWAPDDDEWDPSFVQRCVTALQVSSVSAVMPQFELLFRKAGRREPGTLPPLQGEPFRDLCEFLVDTQPNLIFAMYRRSAIAWFAEYEPTYDWLDCYVVLRTILTGGSYRLLDQPLYVAGIDGESYVPKSVQPMPHRRFSHGAFNRATTGLIVHDQGLRVAQKGAALVLLWSVRLQSFWVYERNFRRLPAMAAYLAALPLRVFRKLALSGYYAPPRPPGA